jgi:hypothetical protein
LQIPPVPYIENTDQYQSKQKRLDREQYVLYYAGREKMELAPISSEGEDEILEKYA